MPDFSLRACDVPDFSLRACDVPDFSLRTCDVPDFFDCMVEFVCQLVFGGGVVHLFALSARRDEAAAF